MKKNTGHIDISNMGRCDVCGKPIDMEHEQDNLYIMSTEETEAPEKMAEAMADALRRCGRPEDHAVADAFEEENGFKAHSRCYEDTSIPEKFPHMEDFDEEPL